jgi:tRNA/tmRNA/rRNA uracil-C5-methylase (TrmA/RlmC/RlmD family)
VSGHQLTYKHSIEEKKSQLRNLFKEIDCSHMHPKIIPTPIASGFRNRAKYKIFGSPDRFEIKGTDPIQGEVPYENALWLLPEWGRTLVTQIIDVVSKHLDDYWVDGLEVQLSHGNEHAHLTLSVKRQNMKSYEDLAESLIERVPALHGVSIPSKKNDFGKSYLLHKINGLHFYAHYSAFFQSNLSLTKMLMEKIKQKCRHVDFCRILDLYCGVGFLSLSIAEENTPVIGADVNKRAVDSARLNAKNLGIRQFSLLCSPVENFIKSIFISPNDLVIIDPPRSGCPNSLIDIISASKPNDVCSISCDLSSHVRDLKIWLGDGYKIQSISAFDMFPFTEFLETAVFLRRNS